MNFSALVENLVVGVVSGLTASAIFFTLLFQLRPKLELSSVLAKRSDSNGRHSYTVKLLNLSIFSVTDLYLELVLYTPQNVPNGQVNQARLLGSVERPYLEGRVRQTEPYANELTFTFTGPLERDWDDRVQHVAVRVSARHVLSQFAAVATMRYYRKSASIREGQFPRGRSLNVTPET